MMPSKVGAASLAGCFGWQRSPGLSHGVSDMHVSAIKNSLLGTIAGNLRQTAEPTIGPHTTAKNWRELTTIKADAVRSANS
jgi:hypothetical protein